MTLLSSDQRKEREKMMKTAETMKAILGGVWRLGRGTATVMGLAMLLALTVGTASTALAGTGVGARFDLGKTNTVNAVSKLVGSVVGPSLTIDNNSTATGATALDLQVEPGKPPFKVNSTTEVQGLNVDSIDSKNSSDFLQEASDRDDFLPNDTYVNDVIKLGPGSSDTVFASADCDAGDKLLGGGGLALDPDEDTTTASVPFINGQGWDYQIRDNGSPSSVQAFVLCADFPPEH
jgi:azurin